MDVMIIATKTCNHRPNLEQELKHLQVRYTVVFVEEQPELAERFAIRHSPNLVINNEVVFRGQPTESELKCCLGLEQAG